jgi:hypothetical protein
VIVFALALTAAIADSGAPVWWVMPAAVLAALTFSVCALRSELRPRANPSVERYLLVVV